MKNIIISIFVVSAFVSCQKVLELDEETKTSKLVVNSLFDDQGRWEVNVSRSLSVLDNGQLSIIDDAIVSIYEGGNLVSNLIYDGEKYIALGLISSPIAGKEYRVEVSAPNYNSVSSKDICPVSVPLINVVTDTAINSFNEGVVTFDVTFQDPGGSDNYYGIGLEITRYYIQSNTSGGFDTILSDVYEPYINSTNPIIDNSGTDNFSQTLTFKDNLIEGERTTLSFDYSYYYISSPNEYIVSKIKFYSFSEATYNYTKSYEAFRNTDGNPFAEPVQVYTNVENGFGIFGGRSIYELEF